MPKLRWRLKADNCPVRAFGPKADWAICPTSGTGGVGAPLCLNTPPQEGDRRTCRELGGDV